MHIEVREERRGDERAIHDVTREAFATATHSSGTEQDIVDALREAGALTVSLVAEVLGEVVGHVAVSPVSISSGADSWFGLGPVSVAPKYQGRGVGAALMRQALTALQEQGAHGCVLLGSPAYYQRFGFEQAAPLAYPGPPAEFFQAVTWVGETPEGVVQYHKAFEA